MVLKYFFPKVFIFNFVNLGYLELLSQLTRVGDVSESTFKGIAYLFFISFTF